MHHINERNQYIHIEIYHIDLFTENLIYSGDLGANFGEKIIPFLLEINDFFKQFASKVWDFIDPCSKPLSKDLIPLSRAKFTIFLALIRLNLPNLPPVPNLKIP